jgi:hypothetical protein
VSSREIVRFVKAISIPISVGMAFHASVARCETLNEESVQAAQRGSEASNINSAAPHDPDEIVVTATRRGEAEVAAQDEFGEGEIASRGVDNIRDLIKRLSPFIGESGDDPLILINGKPAGYDQSILYYPAEALERLALLKPEAAAYYGEPAGKPVINLVLKKNFSMLNADAGFSFATAGGRYGGTFAAGRSAINGETRWNVQAQVGADSALFRSERNVPRKDGVFDSVGFLTSAGGGEIDAALSAISGKPVTFAAIPPTSQSGIPELVDFVATAGISHAVDPNRFETLEPSRRAASLNIGVTRPLGDFTASMNLNVSRTTNRGLRGLPMTSFVIPVGNPWSPFADDVVLMRPFAGNRALRSKNGTTSLGATMTLNGKIAGWRTSLSANYSRNWADSLLENGIDIARIQRLIRATGPDFSPYGSWDTGLLLANWSKTQGENFGIRLNAQKPVLKLPAGPLIWSITTSVNQSRSKGQQGELSGDDEPLAINAPPLRQVNGQAALSIPIARRGKNPLGRIGDLAVSLSASVETMTNSRARKRLGGSIYWTPWPVLELRGSIDFAGASPSFDQLNGPIVSSIVRVFDYARKEAAEPVWITGGNPDLGLGRRRSLTLASKLRPLDREFLTLNLTYRQVVANDGVAPFPDLTPAIERAFPERIMRGGDGRLLRVDARAVNLEKETDAELSSSLTMRWEQRRGLGAAHEAEDPLQFGFSIGHRWRLSSVLTVRPGTPSIDQLRDSGQPRHNLILDASLGKRGVGANLSGNWSSRSRLRGAAGTAGGFRFRPAWNLAFSAFVEPDRLIDLPKENHLLTGVRLSLEIQNLLGGYRRVLLDDGNAPAGYSRDEIDPIGREVRITIRKAF